MKKKTIGLMILITSLMIGCTTQTTRNQKDTEYACRTIDYYDYSAPVPASELPVDDSYFQTTFFGGDSRMGSLYLYSNLRDKGASIWYCESLSLFRIYDMKNSDMESEFGDNALYTLLTTTTKENIYILLGINEIRSDDFDAWKKTYATVIQDIKKANPKSHIYIMNTYYPRAISGLDETQMRTQVEMLNEAMMSLAKEQYVYYYDTNNDMMDMSGLINSAYVWDGIHLNPEGSQIFADAIAKHVVQEETYVKKICE